jgi:uncharacterized protein YndB with AHSA1/START domain
MDSIQNKKIKVEAIVKAPRKTVWKHWTTPEDITQWNNASQDWHTPHAKADLRPGGEFHFRMEAKDGSACFDFGGVYDKVREKKFIAYTIEDGRKVEINFMSVGAETKVIETFEAESQNSLELQRNGWQAILNNFKNYNETKL